MQNLINVLAVASFAVSSMVVGAGAYVYANQDALRAEAQKRVAEGIKDAIGGSQLGSALLSGPSDPIEGMDESGAVPIEVIPFGG